MKKSKARKEIEALIVKGHRAGMCDSSGNSTTTHDGRFIAKGRNMTHATIRKRYYPGGRVESYVDGHWVVVKKGSL